MPEEGKWYVVHTYSGYENKVASNLEKTVENRSMGDLIQEIRVPTETVTEIKDKKKREVEPTNRGMLSAISAAVRGLLARLQSRFRFPTRKWPSSA